MIRDMSRTLGPKSRVQLSKTLNDLVAAQVRRELAPLKQQSTNWMAQINSGVDPNQSTKRTGENNVGRALLALAAGKCNRNDTLAFSVKEYGRDAFVTKALAAGSFSGGGALIGTEIADDVIDLLRGRSIVRRMGPDFRGTPKGTKEFPRVDVSASASYVGENQDIPLSEPEFGQAVLIAKKLAALVVVSSETLMFGASMAAEETIRDDLIQVMTEQEDLTLLRGSGTVNTPKGLRFQALAANVTATNGVTSANIESDFRDLRNALTGANVPMLRPHFLMAPRSLNFLQTLRDANGNIIFTETRATNPTIYGTPVLVSTHIPVNLGGGNETEIYFVDASEILFGEVDGMMVDVTGEGGYTDSGSNVVHAFQRDQVMMRVKLFNDIVAKHPEAIAVKTAVTWGA